LRDRLYAAIGFQRGPAAALPSELGPRRITNPDAPRNEHRIRVQRNGETVGAIPVLYSSQERYDPVRGGEFFDYLEFKFRIEGWDSPTAAATAEFVDLKDLTGFMEQVGNNTEYLIHPEEIIADNFVLIVLGTPEPRSPAILERIRAALITPVSGLSNSPR